MKKAIFSLLFSSLFFFSLPLMAEHVPNYPVEDSLADYCYKPSKPLWLSTAIHKKQYREDLEEYERCKQHFYQVHQNIARMKMDSEQRSRDIQKEYEQQQNK